MVIFLSFSYHTGCYNCLINPTRNMQYMHVITASVDTQRELDTWVKHKQTYSKGISAANVGSVSMLEMLVRILSTEPAFTHTSEKGRAFQQGSSNKARKLFCVTCRVGKGKLPQVLLACLCTMQRVTLEEVPRKRWHGLSWPWRMFLYYLPYLGP